MSVRRTMIGILILAVGGSGSVLAGDLLPTPTPRAPQLGLYLNPPVNQLWHGPGEIFSLVMSMANPEPFDQTVSLVSVLAVDGYSPIWLPDQEPVPITIPAGEILMNGLITSNLPDRFPDTQGAFFAALLSDREEVLAWDSVSFALRAPGTPPTPTPGPQPSATATPAASGNTHHGYRRGYAQVLVENLPYQPASDKAVIFCLGADNGSNWVNVRHRAYNGGTYQLKGGLHTDVYDCQGETHVYDSEPAGSGLWHVWWDSSVHTIRVASPAGGDASITIEGGTFAFNNVYPKASCGGYIGWSTTASVQVLSFDGEDYGPASNCGG